MPAPPSHFKPNVPFGALVAELVFFPCLGLGVVVLLLMDVRYNNESNKNKQRKQTPPATKTPDGAITQSTTANCNKCQQRKNTPKRNNELPRNEKLNIKERPCTQSNTCQRYLRQEKCPRQSQHQRTSVFCCRFDAFGLFVSIVLGCFFCV